MWQKVLLNGATAIVVVLIAYNCTGNVKKNIESSEATRWGDSQGVGGTFNSMQECKEAVDKTALKYGYQYIVTMNDYDYFSIKLLNKISQKPTDYIAVCDEKKGTYWAMFEIPPEH